MSASTGATAAPASTPVRKRKKDTLTLDTKTDTDLLRTPVSKHSTKPSGTKSPWWNAFLESPLVNVDAHGGVSPQMRGRFSPSPKASPALKLSSPNSMRNMSRTSLLNSSPTSKLWEAALGTPSSPSRHPRGPIIGSLASAAAESSSNLAALASSSSSDHLSVPPDPSLAITGTAIYPGPRSTPERKRSSGTYTFLRHVAPSSESRDRDLDPVLSDDVDLPHDTADRDRLLQLGSAVAQQTAADAPIGVHLPPMRDKVSNSSLAPHTSSSLSSSFVLRSSPNGTAAPVTVGKPSFVQRLMFENSVRKPAGVRDESESVDDAAKNLMALENKPVRNSSTLVFGSSILGTKRTNGAANQPQVAPSDSDSDSESSDDDEEEDDDASADESPSTNDKKLTTPPKRTSSENKDASGERSAKRRRGAKAAEKRCNCKKSKCLKLYCECFARQGYCKDCNCQGCNNTEEYEDVRQKAIQVTLERDPNAFFRSSATGAPSSAGPGAGAAAADDGGVSHPKGCHCKKSQCLKKYCECYQANAPCGDLCKCVDCKNGGPNTGSTPNKRRAGVIKPGTKRSPQTAHHH